ncbi:unnamed protein product [Porites lobata]|uniref:Uncharacterized protein n=1 Tax=Porites lobata TaxID=104759 RepID=A0ABN8NI75_9CNID|nr:unnamed protein product [Porites lobata]
METDLYAHVIGPAAMKRSTKGKVDVKLFWKSSTSELPNLYKVASIYYTETLGSYDMVSEWTPTTPLPCDSLTKYINKDPRPKSPIPTDSTGSVPMSSNSVVSGFFKPATKSSRQANPSSKPPNKPDTTHKQKGMSKKSSAWKRFHSSLGTVANPMKPMKVKSSSPVPL